MSKYVICRIIGNELPPRDLPGSRLVVLEYILANEFLDADVKRLWVLNRITSQELLKAYKQRLNSADEQFVELGVDWEQYIAANSRTEKINAIVGINHARNEAFAAGSKIGSNIFILDGDCFFDRKTWQIARAEIEKDQLRHPERQYYALPSARVFIANGPEFDLNEVKLEEPMLMIRSDATELFDKSAAFSVNSKISLLAKLGLRVDRERWYALNSEGPCSVLGMVLHLNTGSYDVETDGWSRYMQRRESINALIERSNRIAEANIIKSSMMRFALFKVRSSLSAAIESGGFVAQKAWFKVKVAIKKSLIRD
jgi:hypothetical protein